MASPFPIELVALAIFTLTYLLFLSKMLNNAVAALFGALLMVAFGVISYADIGLIVDYKTLTLALGMMIIVNVVEQSGLFEYLSIRAVKLTRGKPLLLIICLSLIAIPMSAFFDNITSALILGALTVTICTILGLDYVPYLIGLSIVINITGMLTPVASYPNMMVVEAAKIGFTTMLLNILPLFILLFIVTMLFFALRYSEDLNRRVRKTSKMELESLDPKAAIKDKSLAIKSAVLLTLVILAFLFQERLSLSLEAIALGGAIIMLFLAGAKPEKILSEVHWSTLAFLFGIFLVVGGIEQQGLLRHFASFIANIVPSEMGATLLLLLSSTGLSSLMNNIPVTAVFIPVVENLASLLAVDPTNMFYALVVAASLGANTTLIASPTTVVTSGLAEKHGSPINFMEFLGVGLFLTVIHMAIAAIYFLIRIQVF